MQKNILRSCKSHVSGITAVSQLWVLSLGSGPEGDQSDEVYDPSLISDKYPTIASAKLF